MQIPLGKPAMLLWILVITFAAALKGSLSPIKMVASGPKEGKVSGSLPLTCTVMGAPLDSPRYDWNCVRQAPGGELQFLGWIYPFGNNTGYAPPFQGRVSISADKDKNKISLQLHDLTAFDTATYFCARQNTVMPVEGEAAQKGGVLLWWEDGTSLKETGGVGDLICSSRHQGILGDTHQSPIHKALCNVPWNCWEKKRLNFLVDTGATFSVLNTCKRKLGVKRANIRLHANSVATDRLVFGTGITFSVEPSNQEESSPEVIVLKSKEPKQYDNKLNMACLARTFYPKSISLDVPESDISYDLKAPVVTSEGMYSTMKVTRVEPDAKVTCKAMHKGNKTTASIILPEEKTEEFETANACNVTDASTKDVRTEKVNMLFMSVLCLRVLLAKSIAFNTIMSVKLFLF
ncbi:uncharacterized protein LOC141948430 [Strix uralensis]|uniref:uncharacterized protein LOC141948430 n=1 Tax=Strix uralensis TaxID=36305 RepID=UPI003DA63466